MQQLINLSLFQKGSLDSLVSIPYQHDLYLSSTRLGRIQCLAQRLNRQILALLQIQSVSIISLQESVSS